MRLNQVTVPSVDLHRSLAFYQLLGLKLIVDSLPDYNRFQCPEGGSTFSVHRVDRVPKGEGIYVYFQTEELDRFSAILRSEDIEFSGPKDQTWLWRKLRVKDPDGNAIILFTAGENRLTPPWKVKT